MSTRTSGLTLVALAASFVFVSVALAQGQEGRGRGRAQGSGPEAPAIGFFGSYRVAGDKADPSRLPIIGAWRLNFDKSDPAMRAQGRFKETGTTIYTAVDGGIKTETFLFYPPTRNGNSGHTVWDRINLTPTHGTAH